MSELIQYGSTRNSDRTVSLGTALLEGLAHDGGLYLPRRIPNHAPGAIREARSFTDLGVRMLRPYVAGHLPDAVWTQAVQDALSFPVPLVAMEGAGWDGIHVLELFHGPTLSFKDVGARTLARLLHACLASEPAAPVTVLVATSGDTGSAVADGFSGLPGLDVVLLYPLGQVSPVQERQLIVRRDGVRALAVRGSFDDCQRLVKEAFRTPALRHRRLTSANSINIGRLLPQSIYYAEVLRSGTVKTPIFCVPSGNLGNLTAGVMAHLAGMPNRGFIAAHNANHFFPDVLRGVGRRPGGSIRTLSNAMDVGVPSNLERLQSLLPAEAMRRLIRGYSTTDEDTLATARRVYEATGYLADPHTAVGLHAAQTYREETGDGGPIVVLATAHPAKFPDIVEKATGTTPVAPKALSDLWERPVHVEPVAPTLEALIEILTD